MPSRGTLALLVIVAVALRAAILVADPDEYELSGLTVTGGETARVWVERGEWFRIDPAAMSAISERQAADQRLIDPGDFDYPADGPTRPELVTPQGAAILLAAAWKVTGDQDYMWLQGLQVAVGGLLTLLVAWISMKLFARRRAAVIAAALWAIAPGIAFYAKIPFYEIWAVYAAVGLTALYLVARERDSWKWLALVGLAIALATLFRQGLVLLPLAFAAAELGDRRRAARTLGIVGAACVVGLIPWTVRNLIEFDQPRPFNGVSGQVLWEGLGDDPVFGAVNDDIATFEMVQEEEPGLEYGTPAYDDYLRGKAIDAIADHPLDWARLLGERTVDSTLQNETLVPTPSFDAVGSTARVEAFLNRSYPDLLKRFDPLLFLAGAASAIWLWIRGRRREVALLAAVYVTLLLPAILVSGYKLRYVLPASFVLMILAGAGADGLLSAAARRIRGWWSERPPEPRAEEAA